MSTPSPPTFTVPPGHQMVFYHAAMVPGVSVLSSGLLLAQFGVGGDDPDEIWALFDQAARDHERRDSSSRARLAVNARGVRELVAPDAPALIEVRGGIVWTARRDGLALLLDDEALRQRLLARFLDFPVSKQWFVIDDQWTGGGEFLERLGNFGVTVCQADGEAPFLVEVQRPDGLCIVGFAAGEPRPGEAELGPRPLFRAPRLNRLLTEMVARGTLPSSFFEELFARDHLLLFMAQGKHPRMMGWPGHEGTFLPVFADALSLQRTMSETGVDPATCGVGGMPPRKLFAWAQSSGFGVAMNVFPDEKGAHYVPVSLATLEGLREQGLLDEADGGPG